MLQFTSRYISEKSRLIHNLISHELVMIIIGLCVCEVVTARLRQLTMKTASVAVSAVIISLVIIFNIICYFHRSRRPCGRLAVQGVLLTVIVTLAAISLRVDNG